MTDHHQDSVRMTGSHADSETVKHPPPPPPFLYRSRRTLLVRAAAVGEQPLIPV